MRVSTDFTPQGTLADTKIGLFFASDSTNYASFAIISCDEDGGVLGSGYNSILFATALVPGQTYYVQVDGWSTADFGTFCIAVDELSSAMISSAAVACANLQIPELNTTTYTGWVPLLTTGGQLVAMVRNPAGGAGQNYSTSADPASVTVTTGTVRTSNGQPYLNRNYKINNPGISTPVDVQFFFLNSELISLSSAVGGVGLGGVNVTRQSGALCQANHNPLAGTQTVLSQTGNGSVSGACWVQVQSNSFSNFYLHAGGLPLTVQLEEITAVNIGSRNRISWSSLSERAGDYFELERSADGVQFNRLATIAGKGGAGSYSYWDDRPFGGVNYYRLKMIDKAGNVTYSQVVQAVLNSVAFVVEAYPNPVKDKVQVAVYGSPGSNAVVTLTDATGKVVKRLPVINSGIEISMAGLAPGAYLLKYKDTDHAEIIQITKQ